MLFYVANLIIIFQKKKANIIDKFWLIPPTHLFFKV